MDPFRLTLTRRWFTDCSTGGELRVEGAWACYTLEDVCREPGVKIAGATAIPEGVYRVTLTESARFKRVLPRLHEVPGFSGVLIHAGNTPADTHGCILVGLARTTDRVERSREAMATLMATLRRVEARGEKIEIEIRKEKEGNGGKNLDRQGPPG